jgi:hypothetical protein
VPPLFTEPGWNVHKAAEIGIDDFQANRSPDRSYRNALLRGLMSHAKGGSIMTAVSQTWQPSSSITTSFSSCR